MVAGVVEIRPELELNVLSNPRRLENTDVGLINGRANQRVARYVAVRRTEESGSAWSIVDKAHIIRSYRTNDSVVEVVQRQETIHVGNGRKDGAREEEERIDLADG